MIVKKIRKTDIRVRKSTIYRTSIPLVICLGKKVLQLY